MEQSDLLRKLAAELERLAIQYFVTGSIATTIYGESRLTNDIDVVAALRLDQVDALLGSIALGMRCGSDRRMFTVQHFTPRVRVED